jgi:KaiC/GvpD/RAD55 family RecA-like ATPase
MATKSKLKAVDPKTAEPSKPKILIYGKPGVGKTWTSLDFPSVYYIDTEGGANLSHYTDKLKKSGGVYFGPEQGSQDFIEVIEQVKALATEEHTYKTLVIDSISKIFNGEIAKEMERLGEKDAFGASKKPAVKYTRQLINWIDRLDMNVILIAHEKPVWANDKQIGVTFDAWDKLEYELHLCLNIVKQGPARKALISKTRLQEFAERESFEWAFPEFASRYGRDVIETASRCIVLAKPEQVERIKYLVDLLKVEQDTVTRWLEKAKASSFDEMEEAHILKCIAALEAKINKPQTQVA